MVDQSGFRSTDRSKPRVCFLARRSSETVLGAPAVAGEVAGTAAAFGRVVARNVSSGVEKVASRPVDATVRLERSSVRRPGGKWYSLARGALRAARETGASAFAKPPLGIELRQPFEAGNCALSFITRASDHRPPGAASRKESSPLFQQRLSAVQMQAQHWARADQFSARHRSWGRFSTCLPTSRLKTCSPKLPKVKN